MTRLRVLFSKLSGLFRKARLEQQLDEDVRAHIEMLTEENLRRGMEPEEARYAAMRQFGNVSSMKEECRDRWSIRIIEELIQDIRYGLRQLRRNLGFTAVAVITLALGIGANTAIFSVVNSVLLQPLSYPNPSRLMMVYHVPPAKSFPGVTKFAVSPANYLDWEKQNRVFERMAIIGFRGMTLNGTQPEAVRAAKVSAGFFAVMGVQPQLGRTFTPEEEQSGNANGVILGNAFWHAHFGSNRNIVGQHLRFDGQVYTVIGIMPPDFRFPSFAQIWVPLAWTAQERAVRDNHNYMVVARLKSGTTITQAQTDMDLVSNRLAKAYPNHDAGWGAVVVPLHEDLVGGVRPTLLVLLGAVGFVLLIACANVANLVLEKIIARRKELAIRAALGGSRSRVLRQILTESALLGTAGGAVGLVLAHFGVMLIVDFLPQSLPRAQGTSLDVWVLAFTFVISLFTGIAAGLAPAWHSMKADLNQTLKEGLGRTDSDSGGSRTSRVLVISEVALSLVLLTGAGLLIRTLWALRNASPGFDPHNVLTFTLRVSETKYSKPQERIQLFDRLLKGVHALPGVESVGAIDDIPLGGNNSNWPVAIEGRPAGALAEQPEVDTVMVSPLYFRTMRVPLLRGRVFNESDTPAAQPVIVVSEAMAKRFWPGQDPLGRHLTTTFDPGASLEVVGVVGNVRDRGLANLSPVATMYLPIFQLSNTVLSLVVRTTVDPGSITSAVRNTVHQIDPDQPLQDVMSMDQIIDGSLSERRFSMTLLAVFAGLALLLATVGIYGVIAYSVSRRTHEVGIRMALGAEKTDVLKMVIGQGLKLALIGVAIGVAGALALTRFLSSLLYGVEPTDPVTFIAVSLLLVAVALLACYIPARRAANVDPMVALRYE
jgi:putative ABC transport system permease protein